jgi:hypothetical protein
MLRFVVSLVAVAAVVPVVPPEEAPSILTSTQASGRYGGQAGTPDRRAARRCIRPRFHVHVTVSGPIVPGEGLPDQPAATTCTWTVTMKDASADVPVSIADFHSVDHLGAVFLMGLVPGERPPPPVLHPGQTLTFKLRAYELVGEGMMQWAPDHRHVVAYWDYTVEND